MTSTLLAQDAVRPPRREVHLGLVLGQLRTGAPMSRADIARSTGLGKPLVSSLVDELIHDGVVRELGYGDSTAGGGRRPVLLEIEPHSSYLLGIHLGVRQISVIAADAHGRMLGDWTEVATPRGRGSDAVPRIVEAARRALAAGEVPPGRLGAVGVCLPGLVDPETGTCIYAPNLGWRDLDLRSGLQEALGVPVHVHNLAQACAAAEVAAGALRGVRDGAFVYVASSIEAAVVKDGRILHGSSGIAGQLGHCPTGGSELCACGNTGCLETRAAVPAVVRAARAGLEAGRTSVLAEAAELTGAAVAEAAAARDPLALEVVTSAGSQLGTAISWLVNLFHPEVVVIGGDVAVFRDEMLYATRASVVAHSLPHAAFDVAVVPSALDVYSELQGAVQVAMRSQQLGLRRVAGS